ncbi:MAG TPA: ceramidase domain-containing protein [Microvirga sp.]|jgi:hypothetical protein
MSSTWFTTLDHYCERLDPGFWAEPLNAVTNAAFLIAALMAYRLWRRAGGQDGPSLWLILVTASVGIGSFLFHTFATRWSLLADVIPIAIFIYSYFILAMRRALGLGAVAAALAMGGFVLFNVGFEAAWKLVLPAVTLNGSVGYLPAALALFAVGGLCRLRAGDASRRALAARALIGAGSVFVLSLAFRSVDAGACAALPVGTHFMWHVLNALVLFILMRAAIALGPHASARTSATTD